MNALDLAVVAVVALSAIFAFARGFVREALSIVAWVGAALITLYGFGQVYGLVLPLVPTPLLADLIAGVGLFIVSLVVLTILTGYVARMVRISALSPIDRGLGFVFGLVRGAALMSLAWLLLDLSVQPNDRPAWIREAKSAPFLAEGADVLRTVLPESLRIKSAAAIDDGTRAVDRAREAQRAMRALASPVTPIPVQPTNAPLPSYNTNDRHNLDRLIENQH